MKDIEIIFAKTLDFYFAPIDVKLQVIQCWVLSMHSEEFKREEKPGFIMRIIVVNWRSFATVIWRTFFRQLELISVFWRNSD